MKSKIIAGVSLVAMLAFASVARADITIGLVAPVTGPVAAYGDQVRNGAQAAVDAINEKGGMLGEKVVLKISRRRRRSEAGRFRRQSARRRGREVSWSAR